MALIERPTLEIRDEELLAAQAIARTTGLLDAALIDSYIAKFQELRRLVVAGGLPPAICPELTNANPSAPHTVILETMSWLLAQIGYRINQIPDQNLIEFARLFGIELKPATKAETMLRFTVQTPGASAVTVPVGTRVSTTDDRIVFETTADLVIPALAASGEVLARSIAAGNVLLAPNKLTRIVAGVANISAATNPAAIDAGTEAETIESALERMRRYQRRTERIVTARDLEEAISFDAMNGNGIVRVFPFIKEAAFDVNSRIAGHTTVIVMTSGGEVIDGLTRARIGALLNQIVGNQYVYIVDPFFANFNIQATIRLNTDSQASAVLALVEKNLRDFYSAERENFGRPILRSEIIAVIEGTTGVDRIITEPNAPILAAPLSDSRLNVWELPKLINVILTVV